MGPLGKILTLVLFSTFKFVFAFPIAKYYGFNYLETVLYTSIGGIAGVSAFFFFSDYIFKSWFYLRIVFRRTFKIKKKKGKKEKKKKSLFSPRNRKFVRFINKYGIAGVAILTPSLLSIPVGTLLASRINEKYTKNKTKVFSSLCLSVILWSLIFSGVVLLVTFKMKHYKAVFFDLDRTLWDLDKNSTESLTEMYYLFNLPEKGIKHLESFIRLYNQHNNSLWDLYRQGRVSKTSLRTTRFKLTLAEFGIKNSKLTSELSTYFYKNTPHKGNLIEGAMEVLIHLKNKNIPVYIITNGFEDVQHIKIQSSGIAPYITELITSDKVNAAKPDIKIFNYALQLSNAAPSQVAMVGDDLIADCEGAINCGIDAFYFNPNKHLHQLNIQVEKDLLIAFIPYLN